MAHDPLEGSTYKAAEEASKKWAESIDRAKEFRNIQTEINTLSRINAVTLTFQKNLENEMTEMKGQELKNAQQELDASNKALGMFQKKTTYYKQELDFLRGHLTLTDQIRLAGNGILDMIKGQGLYQKFNFSEMLSEFNNRMYWGKLLVDNGIKIGAGLLLVGKIAIQIGKKFQEWDESISSFRQSFGLFRDDILSSSKHVTQISRDMQLIARDLAKIGVNIGTVIGSFESLSSISGGIWNVNKDLVKTLSAMSVSLGVSQEVSAGMLRNFGVMAGTTLEAQTNSVMFAQALSNAAGVSFGQVAMDLGKASDSVLLLSRRGVPAIIKSAVELRRMGSSMDEAANSAETLLNFTQNIQDEMESSVLLGRSVNLQRARELAYAGDLEGSTKEILRLSKQVGFTGLDYFQKGAFAKSVGMSANQLNNLLQTDKQIEKSLRSQDPTVKAMAQEYQRLQRSSQGSLQSELEKQKQTLMTKNNLARTASISASWNQIVSKLAYVALPLIDKTLGGVNWLMTQIADNLTIASVVGATLWAGVKKGWISFKSIGTMLDSLGTKIFFFGDGKKWKWVETLGDKVSKIGMWFGKLSLKASETTGKITALIERIPLGKVFFRLSNMFSGLLGGISARIGGLLKIGGRFLMPLLFAFHIFGEIKNILNDPVLMGTKGFFAFNGKLIIAAFKAIGKALWSTINDLSFGLPNLLLSVIQKAYRGMVSWMEKIPFLGKLISGRTENAGLGKNIQTRSTAAYIPAVTVTPTSTKIQGIENNVVEAKPTKTVKESGGKSIDDLHDVMSQMLADLRSGKIRTNTHLDSQLVSATIARNTDFRGGYGVNKV